jgi:hypothetical protein
MLFRQGDLWFKKIDKMPEGEIKKSKSHVLALGEHTGHAHILKSEKPIDLVEFEDGEKAFVVYMKAKLTHGTHDRFGVLVEEEHETEVLEPGIYRQWFERTYDYFQKNIGKVVD